MVPALIVQNVSTKEKGTADVGYMRYFWLLVTWNPLELVIQTNFFYYETNNKGWAEDIDS